jgi:quercetin dioxygenase-like cupin family protein
MHETVDAKDAIKGLVVGRTTSAAESGRAKLTPLLRERVTSLPRGSEQEIRVLFARLDPGDRTPTHSHRFPVTVYVTRGTFTLDLANRGRVDIAAGEAFVEPAEVRMTGYNHATEPAEMALFYACDPDAPFADAAE